MENSTSDPASFTIRLFGLGNPGTGFYHLVHESWGNRKRMITAYGVGAALFVLFNYSSYVEKMAAGPAMIHALFSAAGIVASGIIICASIMAKNPKKHRSFPSGFSIFFIRHIC